MSLKKIILILQITLSLLTGIFGQVQELPEITLIIEKPVAQQTIVITAEEIREKNVESLTSLLQSAGIQILAYGPYGLESKPSIRGFTDETVRVVIDGVCVNNAQYGTFDFSSIDVNSIEKIEIVKGGFTEGITDEGAVGGVIYITTKSIEYGQHIFGDSSIKSFFNLDYPLDTFSQKISYRGQTSDSSFLKAGVNFTFAQNHFLFDEQLSGNQVQRNNAEVLDGSGEIKYSVYFAGGNLFSAGESFYGGNKNTPGPEHGHSGNQRDYDNNLTLNLNLPSIVENWRFESGISWLSNTRFYTSLDEDSKHYVNTLKMYFSGFYYGMEHYSQGLGLSFDYTNLSSTNDGNHTQFAGSFKETAKYSFNEHFSISLPFAVNFCNENFAFIPKLGVKYNVNNFSITGNVYRMIQFPNMDDLYWNGSPYFGNPDLKPEDGWGGEVSFSGSFGNFSGYITGFTNYYQNKIQWAGTSPQNVASAFYAGLDGSIEAAFFEKDLQFKLNLEYLYNRLLDKSNSLTYGKKIMWTPDFTAGFSAVYNNDDFNLILEGNYVGKRYTSNLNVYFMEPYFLVNACGELKCWKNVAPYIRLDNIFNTKYQAVENYPMPGFSMTLGAKLRFDYE